MRFLTYIFQRRLSRPVRESCIVKNGVVASKHPLIGKTGVDIMRKGGNAIDAAVASAFVDCVVEPAMNGIGGEGVMAIHTAKGENIIIDYVGRPSKNCTPDMYELIEEAEPGWMGWRRTRNDENIVGYKAAVVPGTVAGLSKALELYGTMELKEVLEPAIKIAEEGFIVGWWTVSHIISGMETFSRFPHWRKLFLVDGLYPPRPYNHRLRRSPSLLVNKDLARTLRLISEAGPEAFYKGEVAEAIANDMLENGGLITLEDLRIYEPLVLKPTPGTYRGLEVVYDPSHAGLTLIEMLNILEGFDLSSYGFGSFKHLHLLAEAIGLAFSDRFEFMGDPEFIEVPQKTLASKKYAEERRKEISFERAAEIHPGDPWHSEECTTVLAIADSQGNSVVVNQTLVNIFGCGVVVPGTGIVLNNAMYGLNPEPGHANSINGRKRRIQNVCPIILLKEGAPYLSVGAPGGRAIQPSIVQTIVNVVDFGMDIQSAIDSPRIVRETDEVLIDNRFSKEVYEKLLSIGHRGFYIDNEIGNWGRPVGIVSDFEKGLLYGGCDCSFLGFEAEAVGF
ncbi:gamma-glutamyltransferase [Candidatus Bathyarchaeota archaeon]|nr:gamma-glutamyltransferase [Candidatus Bathyarchaeota archaeon]